MTTSIQQCVICHEELDRDLSAAPCGHVFHNVCIDRWLLHGSYCPICHEELPQGLLRLFFEPKQQVLQAPLSSSSGSVSDGTESSSGCGVDEYRQQRAPSDPQVTQLRRELASKTEESDCLSQRLGEIQCELVQVKASNTLLTATSDATKNDLVRLQALLSKVREENRRLLMELDKAQKLLCHRHRDFMQSIPSNRIYSRPCNGLGQMNPVGFARTEPAMTGQLEQLPRSSERVWRPIVSRDPSDNECREIGFQDLRANPVGSKREYQCLSEAPSGRCGRWRDGSYDNSPSMGLTRDSPRIMEYRRGCQVGHSFLPQRLVVESRHGNSRGTKRPPPSDFTDPTQVIWRGLSAEKPRASAVEGDSSMILLGSDEENGNETGKGWPDFDEWRDERDLSSVALDWPNGVADARCTSDVASQLPLPGSRGRLD